MDIITQKVKAFYEELPFNKCEHISDRIDRVKSNFVKFNYPDLDNIIAKGKVKSILEVGCGTGWLANTLGYHYDAKVLGIDLTAKALSDANGLRDLMELTGNVIFAEADLFKFQSDEQFDLLVSMGVLHHTFNTKAAFDSVEKFVKTGGFIYIGLYHKYGREVFLDMFKSLINEHGEEYAFETFIRMRKGSNTDSVFQRSWFRDQVCHVHENQHSFEEVSEWLEKKHYKIISTSINKFKHIQSLNKIFDLEKQLSAISFKRNHLENIFFPGFFTVLARKM